MSSAPARTQPLIGRAFRGVIWAIVLAVVAAGAAGLIGQAWHAPGSPARAELTYDGDAALDARLDDATDQLRRIAVDVEQLATEAKTALEEIASANQARLRDSLQRGGQAASTIDIETRALRDSLADLPGDGPAAVIEYSNASLVRRAAVLTAVDAAAGLATEWQQVTSRAVEAAQITTLIAKHDTTFLDAAEKGRARRYREAATILDGALLTVAEVQTLRKRIVAGTEHTVLDDWIDRTTDYDVALKALYLTLDKSGGVVTPAVVAARRVEQKAFARLPPDRRTIIVIVAEVARGGLTQAVLAIDDAHGRIDEALAEAT